MFWPTTDTVARCPLPHARRPLPVGRRPLPVACCPMPDARCLLPDARWEPVLQSPVLSPTQNQEVTVATTDFARMTGSSGSAYSEGRIARPIEQQTAKVPSDAFLWMAVGAMAASASLQAMGNKHVSL